MLWSNKEIMEIEKYFTLLTAMFVNVRDHWQMERIFLCLKTLLSTRKMSRDGTMVINTSVLNEKEK